MRPKAQVYHAYSQSSSYQMPIAVPTNLGGGSGYGGPGNYNGGQKPTSKLLIAGIIVLVLALIALAVAMIFVFKPFGLFEEEVNATAPTIGEVEALFEEGDVEESMLSRFTYVNTEDLEPLVLKNTKVGEVNRNNSGNSKEIYCEATADAEVRNNSITATTTLTMRLVYDKDSGSWRSNGVQTGNVTGTPEGPADITAIEKNIPALLRSYDSAVAADFSNSEIASEANLTKEGGTASFVLTKPAEGDGEAKTCTVNTEVTWNDSRGWQVDITSIDGLDSTDQVPDEPAPEEPTPADSGANSSGSTQPPASSGSSGGSSGQPTMLLVCYSGDLVQVPGVIEFEGSRILLKTDHVIRVEFDNRVYITTYFELTGNGGWYRGQHTTVIGEISASGALGKAPLVINVDYV